MAQVEGGVVVCQQNDVLPNTIQPMQQMMWFKSPPNVYFGTGTTSEALKDLGRWRMRRCFILTDRHCHNCGYTKIVADKMDEMDIVREVFADVDLATEDVVDRVVKGMKFFLPDCLIAIGGGSVMDVAKVSRVLYDPSNPLEKLSDMYPYNHLQLLIESQSTGPARPPPCDMLLKKMVCIPTTSSTGGEMSPIAWILQNDIEGDGCYNRRRPIVCWRMLPDVAVIDGSFTKTLPKEIVATGGFAVMTRALESAVSKFSSEYTFSFSVRAMRLLFAHLYNSYTHGDLESRSHCHNASSVAGLAAGNAFVGIGHALAYVLQEYLASPKVAPARNIDLGAASAMIVTQVIRYNASRSLTAEKGYAQIANELFVESRTTTGDAARVDILINKIEELKKQLSPSLPMLSTLVNDSMKEEMISVLARDALKVVGCSLTNPVDVSEAEARKILLAAYNNDSSMTFLE